MTAVRDTGTRMAAACAVCLWLLVGSATALPAQQADPRIRVELAVDPQEVTVGDRFHAALRVVPPPGYQVEYGEFASNDTLQSLGPVSLTGGDASGAPRTAIYSLVAWVAGTPLRASVDVRFTAPDGRILTRSVQLQLPRVVSVLPPEGEEVAPRPPKPLVDPVAGGLPWWWWLLLLLGALLAAWWAYRYLMRSDGAEEHTDSRAWALAQLDRRAGDLLRAGDFGQLYEHTSWVLRTYIHRLRPALGLDLTTTELLRLLEPEDPDADPVRALSLLLRAADRVKFARHLPAGPEAAEFLKNARLWVLAYPPPPAEATEEKRAA